MASVMLHFSFPESYPVLDFRALWSLRIDQPKRYCFDFWTAYTGACRKLAEQARVTLRALDQALWEYSKQHQLE